MSEKENLLSKSISDKTVSINHQNKNYTTPRTYGVYEILATNDSKRFRFGNHPVRENELIREFENIKRIALFLERENAQALTSLLNR